MFWQKSYKYNLVRAHAAVCCLDTACIIQLQYESRAATNPPAAAAQMCAPERRM